MSRKKRDYQRTKSSLGVTISRWVKKNLEEELTFGQILDKYCKIGQSRNTIRNILAELTRGEIAIKDSTLYDAINGAISQGTTSFRIKAMFPENPLRKKRTTVESRCKKKTEEISMPGAYRGNLSVVVNLKCRNCKGKRKTTLNVRSLDCLGLLAVQCPNCQQFGKDIASFMIDDVTVRKAVIRSPETGNYVEFYVDHRAMPVKKHPVVEAKQRSEREEIGDAAKTNNPSEASQAETPVTTFGS